MGKLRYPTWESEYRSAISEVNAMQLPGRIAAAQQAINERLMQLAQGLDGDSERHAIRNALSALGALQAIYNGAPTTVIL
jgi:surfactin synthase thioesterase subunit